MFIKQETNILNKGEVKKMKKSKLVVSLVLCLLIVLQSMSVLAGPGGPTVNLGNAVVSSYGTRITGNTLTTYQPSVGQSVYYDFNYSGNSSNSLVVEITDTTPCSVVDYVYTYNLNDIYLNNYFGEEDASVTARVYDESGLLLKLVVQTTTLVASQQSLTK